MTATVVSPETGSVGAASSVRPASLETGVASDAYSALPPQEASRSPKIKSVLINNSFLFIVSLLIIYICNFLREVG